MPRGRPRKEQPEEAKQTTPAAVSLTAGESQSADKLWNAKMDDFKQRMAQANVDSLVYRYDLGKFLAELYTDGKKWGNRTAQDVATSLNVDTSTLRRCGEFAAKWTDEQFKRLIAGKLSWTDVKILIPIQDVKARGELETKLIDGKISQIDASRAARDIATKSKEKGVKTDNRGGMSPKTVFRVVSEISKLFLERLGEFSEGLKLYEKLEDGDRKNELASVLKGIKSDFDKIAARLEKLGKSL